MSLPEIKNEINFYVNSKLQTIKDQYPLTTSLNWYIRNVLKLTGTKVYCHEGGCGVCVVNATEYDPISKEYKDISVNSCLFPLYSCDGYSFTTVEGIGSKNTKLNPIQKRLADKNGSQCGFCSPGFVMSMYSTLKQNSRITKQEIERSLDGNICRCTGYRAILDTMKTFSVDESPIDIEDLNSMKCLNNCEKPCSNSSSFDLTKDNKEWKCLTELEQLRPLLSLDLKYRFVFGNTSIGVFKKQGPFDGYINLKKITELYEIKLNQNQLEIGSNISITKLIQVFKEYSSERPEFSHLGYLGDCLKKVGNTHVRNVATWTGNLALKKEFSPFPSDVLTILEIAGAKLNILTSDFSSLSLTLREYLDIKDLKPNKYLIKSMSIPGIVNQNSLKIKYLKVSPRSVNSHAYINCGFRFEINKNFDLLSQPCIVFNGLGDSYFQSEQTENFLLKSKNLNKQVLNESIQVLLNDLNSSGVHDLNDPLLPSSKYLVQLSLSLYYKFLLGLQQDLEEELKSTLDVLIDTRSVTSSEQVFESNSSLYPITKHVPKINAYSQTSGETKYVDDLSLLSLQTHGALILSTIANGKIDSIDASRALQVPGVIQIFFAKDIPGVNDFMPKPTFAQVEQIFADNEIVFCGQPIGLVVAETHEIAKKASKMVQVTYKDVQKPILTIQEAIKQNSFHPKPSCGDLIRGDAESAISNSKHVISGEFFFDSSQFNFYLEGVITNCEPTEDGYKIECTTQWIDSVQRSVAMALGIQNSSCIDVQVKQLGGGFGGKTTRANIITTAAAIGAYHLRRPVKIHLDLNDCMDIIGKRPPWFVKYRVGFDDDGKLNAIDYDWYSDPGFTSNGSVMFACFNFFDNAYKCDNYSIRPNVVKTNKPASTEVRSPDVFPSYCVTEQLMEHVASYLNKDPLEVRKINFFNKGDKTASGHLLPYIDIATVVENLRQSSEFDRRKKEIKVFNSLNKYKKKGISIQPMRYPLTYSLGYYNALVSIRHHDGSVAVSHGGIEMGQGIHTKVAQVCAYELGIPIEIVSVKSTNNLVNPNILWTGGSVTSELCCKSVIEACKLLNKTLEPVRKLMPENYTWPELVEKAFTMNLNLSSMYLQRPHDNIEDFFTYDIDAAACTEVIIDVLTGESQVLRTDILYDCGESINGLIDIGQAEGGFMMGLGYMLLERTVYDPETGKCLNNGTWEYKPPLASDVPIDFRIKFVENKPNPVGVLGSKATGEPPLILSNSILYAIRMAISSARKDHGVEGYFKFDLPASVDNIQQACLVNLEEIKF